MSATEATVDPFSDEGLAALHAEQQGEAQPPAETAPEAPAPTAAQPDPDAVDDAEEQAADEEHLYAGKFKSIEAMEESYRNLEQLAGRLGNELGQHRRGPEPQQAQQYDQQQPTVTNEQLLEAFDENPLAVIEYVANLRAAEAVAAMQSELQPIVSSQNRQAAGGVIEALGKELGADVVERNRVQLAEAINADPDFYAVDEDTRYRRIRATLRDLDATSAPQPSPRQPRARTSSGQYAPESKQRTVHVEGGSNGARTPHSQADRYADLPAHVASVYAAHDQARSQEQDRYGVKGPAR